MIFIIYIICCIIVAWYTEKPWILGYSVIPIALQLYTLSSSIHTKEPLQRLSTGCGLNVEQQIVEWKSLGGPYYLHTDSRLVHLLYQVVSSNVRSKLVHLCNIMLRMVEERDQTATEVPLEERQQMKDWYIELINQLEDNATSHQLRELMYKHIAIFLL